MGELTHPSLEMLMEYFHCAAGNSVIPVRSNWLEDGMV